MKVKALCGVFYEGELHSCGDVFESSRVLPNTVIVPKNKTEEKPEEKPEVDLAEPVEEEAPVRRGRRRGDYNA